MYNSNFLISGTIRYDCVLGLDFLVANNLVLRRENVAGLNQYLLVGLHGKARICAKQLSPNVELTGVVDVKNTPAGAAPGVPESKCGGKPTLLFHPHTKLTTVSLAHDVVIPGRTEIILDAQLEKNVAWNIRCHITEAEVRSTTCSYREYSC